MKRFLTGSMVAAASALISVGLSAAPAAATAEMNSGFYDHQIIQYEATAEATSSPQAAQLISKGNVVYHIVDKSGNPPAVQCARLKAALPNVGSSCNVLNFIPTEVGYQGGAWNLQIFTWNPGVTPRELTRTTTSSPRPPRVRAPWWRPTSWYAAPSSTSPRSGRSRVGRGAVRLQPHLTLSGPGGLFLTGHVIE